MSGERTEAPTARRKKELRKKGVVARSSELPPAVALVALALLLPPTMARLVSVLHAELAVALGAAANPDTGDAQRLLGRSLANAAAALAPLVAVLLAAGVGSAVLLARSKPNLLALTPRRERVSPKASLRRMVSVQAPADLLKSVVKLALIVAVGYGACRTAVAALRGGVESPADLVAVVGDASFALLRRAALVALVVGVADALWVRRRYLKQARMTKDETKNEQKMTEGNPQIKGAIRAKQSKLSRTRMIAAIAKADVVLANPTHIAVALAYTDKNAAPTVVAKGADAVAERIKAEARKHGVAVMENRPLARALFRLEIGDTIPAELFRAVAEVLATVYAARRRTGWAA